jgi:hypothetical protein
MSLKTAIVLLFLGLAVVLAVVAAFVPVVQGRLLALAVASLALALFIERIPA